MFNLYIDFVVNMLYNIIVNERQFTHKKIFILAKAREREQKMKKYETLKKTLETMNENERNETLKSIINNNDIIVESLTTAEQMSVLMFAEIEKALRTKEHQLVLDCNYANSKFAQNSILKVDYYRLAIANSMIQIYVRKNSFRICTSASKANREKFSQLENELQFKTKYDSKTKRAKTTERLNISYDDIVNVTKQVIAILESTATNKEQNIAQ